MSRPRRPRTPAKTPTIPSPAPTPNHRNGGTTAMRRALVHLARATEILAAALAANNGPVSK